MCVSLIAMTSEDQWRQSVTENIAAITENLQGLVGVIEGLQDRVKALEEDRD